MIWKSYFPNLFIDCVCGGECSDLRAGCVIKHMTCCKYMSVCLTSVDLVVEVGMCMHARMREEIRGRRSKDLEDKSLSSCQC